MNAFGKITLAFFGALGLSESRLTDLVTWARNQAPELGKPADLFLEKLHEAIPDSPERLALFAADAWQEFTGEDPGYSNSAGAGAG